MRAVSRGAEELARAAQYLCPGYRLIARIDDGARDRACTRTGGLLCLTQLRRQKQNNDDQATVAEITHAQTSPLWKSYDTEESERQTWSGVTLGADRSRKTSFSQGKAHVAIFMRPQYLSNC